MRPITFKQIDFSFNSHCRPTGNPAFIIRIIRSRQIVTINHFIQIGQNIWVLTEDMADLTGGRIIVDPNGRSAADKLEAIIEEKRRALNI